MALHLQSRSETGDAVVVARLSEGPATLTAMTCRLPAARARVQLSTERCTSLAAGWRHAADEPAAPHASARAAIAYPTPLQVDATVDQCGTRAQARAVVSYATSAHRRGFCFVGNPAACCPHRPAHPAGLTNNPHTHTSRRTPRSGARSPR